MDLLQKDPDSYQRIINQALFREIELVISSKVRSYNMEEKVEHNVYKI